MKVTRNAVWMFAGRFGGDLLNLALFVTISRTLGPVGIGAYAYGFAVASFVFVIGSIGIEDFGVRQYARLEVERRRPFISELLGAQAVMMTAAVLGLVVYLILTWPSRATLAIVTLLTFYQVATGIAGTLFIPAIAQQRMVSPALIDFTCRGIAYLSTAAAVRFAHAPIQRALWGFFFAAIILLILSLRSAIRHGGGIPHLSISRGVLVRMGNALWSFAAVELFAQLFARVGVITLTLKAGEAAAGVFATGMRLIEVALMPLAIIGVASYPRLSQLYVLDKAEFRRVATELTWLMLLVAGAVFWGLYFISPALLVPVLGGKYAGTEHVIQIMAAVAIVQAVEAVFGRIMLTADRQIPRAGIIAAAAVLGITLNVVLVSRYGLVGAVWAIGLWYAVVDLSYGWTLRAALTGAVVSRSLVTLLGSLAAGAGAAWLSASWTNWRWAPAAAFFVCFAGVLALAFGRNRSVRGAIVPSP